MAGRSRPAILPSVAKFGCCRRFAMTGILVSQLEGARFQGRHAAQIAAKLA
jgi:hypothetical protein